VQHDVGPGDQPIELAGVLDDDRALAAVQRSVHQRLFESGLIVDERSEPSRSVTLRRLDRNDVTTQLSQKHPSEATPVVGQIDDPIRQLHMFVGHAGRGAALGRLVGVGRGH